MLIIGLLGRDMALERARRLHEVRAHTPRGFLAVAPHHRVDNVPMLFERPPKTLGLEHLRPAEARHAITQRQRLLGNIGIVRGAVDGFMKSHVGVDHGFDIAPPRRAPGALHQLGVDAKAVPGRQPRGFFCPSS